MTEDEKIATQVDEQRRLMREAVGKVSLWWGEVEERVAEVLAYLLDPATGSSAFADDGMVGFVIYYRPNNTETRFGIVDAVVRLHMDRHVLHRQRLLLCWEKIYSKINKIKERRNTIAHGAVRMVFRHENKPLNPPQARLTWAWYDLMREKRELVKGQLPGQSIHDLNEIADNFQKWGELLKRFKIAARDADRYEAFALTKPEKAVLDSAHRALHKTIELLADDLKVTLPQELVLTRRGP